MGMNDPLDFQTIRIKGNDAENVVLFYHPKKIFDQSNSFEIWAECLCDPLHGNNSS